MKIFKTILFLTALSIIGCKPKKEQVDLLVTNAKIYTVNDAFEIVEAVAIKEGILDCKLYIGT